MSFLLSPYPIPISQYPSNFSRCPIRYQSFFSESFVEDGKKTRSLATSSAQQGNLTSLAAVAVFGRKPTRRTQLPQFLNVVGFVSRSGTFPDQEDGGVENFVERNGLLATKVGRDQHLVAEDIDAREESFHLVEENEALVTGLEQDNFHFREGHESADNMLDQKRTKERKVLTHFQKENIISLTEEAVELSDSSRRSNRLNAREFIKKIIRLPIEERTKVLDLFEYDDGLLTISDYNDILVALVKAEEFQSALKLFSELPSRGISPDSWTFSIMVQCLCKNNEPNEARRILDEMIQRGFHPNVMTFTILIGSLCKRGRLQNAFEVFEIMKKVGCEPTIRTYNCLINGLCFVGRVEEACELLNKISKSSKIPDIYSFTLVIDSFCKVGRSDEATKLLKQALEMGLVPTIVTYNALLNGYCKEARRIEGLHLLEEMERRGCPPDFITYNTLLHGLLICGEITAALRIYNTMRKAGFQVRGRMMNTLLRGLCRQSLANGGPLAEAKELFEKILDTEYSVSPYTYCLMVQALANGGEINTALAHLLEMVRNGYSPRMMTYNTIFRVLCGGGRVDDALHVLVVMMERDTIPSRFSFSVLFDEFGRQGRHLEAFGIYAAALKRRVNLYRKPSKYGEDENRLLASIQGEEVKILLGNEECEPC